MNGVLKAWNKALGKAENIRSSFNALKTISTTHERIHAGKAFYKQVRGQQAAGAVRTMLLVVGDTAFHLRQFGIKSDQGPFVANLYEAPFSDVNSYGAPVEMLNLNRSSLDTPGITLYNAPFYDVNSIGLEIDGGSILQSAGGSIKSIAGEASTIVSEWILKPNTNYLAYFVNSSTSIANFHQHIVGYEAQ